MVQMSLTLWEPNLLWGIKDHTNVNTFYHKLRFASVTLLAHSLQPLPDNAMDISAAFGILWISDFISQY